MCCKRKKKLKTPVFLYYEIPEVGICKECQEPIHFKYNPIRGTTTGITEEKTRLPENRQVTAYLACENDHWNKCKVFI